jgi:hypothetical protein
MDEIQKLKNPSEVSSALAMLGVGAQMRNTGSLVTAGPEKILDVFLGTPGLGIQRVQVKLVDQLCDRQNVLLSETCARSANQSNCHYPFLSQTQPDSVVQNTGVPPHENGF